MWKQVLAAVTVATAAAFVALGCGGSSDHGSSDAAVDADLDRPDADPNAPDADLTAPDANPAAPDANPAAPDAASSDGGSAPTTCGGFAGLTCDATQYCDWTPDSCGSADQTGVCRPRPELCPDIFDPVCGCDGMTYGNECDCNAAGHDIIHTGMCP